MALDFPSPPYDGQIFVDPTTGSKYIYETATTKWKSIQHTGVIVAYGFDKANAAFLHANAAFDQANTGGGGGGGSMDYLYVNTSTSAANSYASALVNTANTYTNTLPTKIVAAHTQANISYSIANAAFDKANTGGGGSMDYLYVNTSTTAANTYAGTVGTNANTYASAVGTSANAYAATVGTSTNNYTSATYTTLTQFGSVFGVANAAYGQANTLATSANAYASTVGTNANTYAGTVGTAANNYIGSLANTGYAEQAMTVSSLSDSSGTIAWNASTSRMATVTLSGTGRTVSNPTNLKAGSYLLVVKQDAGGSKTITTWGNAFKWPGAVTPTLSTTGSTTDLFSFWCDGTNLYGTYIPDCR